MRQRPAEIDLGLDDPAVSDGQDFGIAETLAVRALSFICHEHPLAVGNQVDELKFGNRPAVGPAALEIGLAIDAIVQRTGEVKIVGDDGFDRRPVLVDVSLVGGFRLLLTCQKSHTAFQKPVAPIFA